ncbi:porin family protein [Tamlana sp. 2_MG-2023]|uniref:porin family protein n=1 Tax=unclassified Tamlana TaxID=2614803 RepID=UPI0026E115E1|nr:MULTISPECIES: porin family protein [unclassified Tamlana]MDO6759563.1 porin family protein [Tamlana sp. 2_MG-2023]MDO6790298.1 porin family protein [Tamlana sp. 1_MG-2023]
MKYIYLLTVILVFSLNVNAQNVKYGVRGGMNISSLDFKSEVPAGNKHRNSVYIGFLADIGLSKTISLIPEIQFSYEGSKADVLQFDYIQMPILVGIKLFKNFHVNLGPQIGLKIHEVDDMAANFGFSSIIGAEYRINQALFVDVRHSNGLINVFDDDSGVDAKNNNFQIGVGYKF